MKYIFTIILFAITTYVKADTLIISSKIEVNKIPNCPHCEYQLYNPRTNEMIVRKGRCYLNGFPTMNEHLETRSRLIECEEDKHAREIWWTRFVFVVFSIFQAIIFLYIIFCLINEINDEKEKNR